jgi:hypothetical protein
MNTRKAQIQAYETQSTLTHELYQAAENVDEGHPAITRWQEAQHKLNDMVKAGYAPRRWGTGLAAHIETGDETPEQIDEYDNAEYA